MGSVYVSFLFSIVKESKSLSVDLTDSASSGKWRNYQKTRRRKMENCVPVPHGALYLRRLESQSRLPACSSLLTVHVLLPLRTAGRPVESSGVYRVLTSSTPRVGGGQCCGKEWDMFCTELGGQGASTKRLHGRGRMLVQPRLKEEWWR